MTLQLDSFWPDSVCDGDFGDFTIESGLDDGFPVDTLPLRRA